MPPREPWLLRHEEYLDLEEDSRFLDLGCGRGFDSAWLLERGARVVAFDFSSRALDLARTGAPEAERVQGDLSRPLPFPDESFTGIVASLSLHYFLWVETMAIARELRRCLEPGGVLSTRLNAFGDVWYGAQSAIELEPDCRKVMGITKRFFSEESIAGMFEEGWEILRLEHRVARDFRKPKALYEVSVRRV
jgi:SAM-dependent methyltransferase